MNTSWEKLDSALLALMEKNDELSDGELVAKSRRLRHLGKFVEILAKRVDERIRENVNPGPIGPLFDKYLQERRVIDTN